MPKPSEKIYKAATAQSEDRLTIAIGEALDLLDARLSKLEDKK